MKRLINPENWYAREQHCLFKLCKGGLISSQDYHASIRKLKVEYLMRKHGMENPVVCCIELEKTERLVNNSDDNIVIRD